MGHIFWSNAPIPVSATATLAFLLASHGDPGVLVRLSQTQSAAYDATCTHASCTVDYDPTTQALICPCHGAAFDPANQAAVLAGPTNLPLTPIPLRIESNGDRYISE